MKCITISKTWLYWTVEGIGELRAKRSTPSRCVTVDMRDGKNWLPVVGWTREAALEGLIDAIFGLIGERKMSTTTKGKKTMKILKKEHGPKKKERVLLYLCVMLGKNFGSRRKRGRVKK
jgi:hypothetical protein